MTVQIIDGKDLDLKQIKSILEKGPNVAAFVDAEDSPLRMISAQGGLWSLLQSAVKLDPYRKQRYRDFDQMATDGVIASALELSVDDSTQYSTEANATVWPTEDTQYKEDIEELFEIVDLENRIWGWVYNIAKYGDFFLRNYTEKGKGIIGVNDNIYPGNVYRIDILGRLAGFIHGSPHKAGKEIVYGPSDFVHFINNFKPNFEELNLTVDEGGNEVTKRLTSAYGSSILENARKVHKILSLLEVSMALARLARAPMIRVYYVNTTGMDPKSRKDLIRNLEEEFKKKKSVDVGTDWYEQKYNPLNNTSDLFLPITGGIGDIRLETIGGDVNVKSIVDIDYVKNKLFAALRVPKQFLGFEEAVPHSLEGGKTLGRLDIRYARMTKKLKRALLEGLYRLIQIHLSFKYQREQDVKDIHLASVPISSSEEDTKMEYLERKIALAQSMQALALDSGLTNVDLEYLIRYTFKHILDLPAFNVDKLLSGETPPQESNFEFKTFCEDLKKLYETKGSVKDIVNLVKSYLNSQEMKMRYTPKNKDLTVPTLSEVKLGKTTRKNSSK